MTRRRKGLTAKKINYIIKHKKKRKSTRELSEDLGVSPSTVRRVWTHWIRTKNPLPLKKPGRPMKPIVKEEEDIVLKAHERYKVGARRLETVIKKVYKVWISHNRIHKILLKHFKAKRNPNKQKRRKAWVRFERKHSLSMAQIDWHESDINGKQVCVLIDDGCRKILVGNEFDNATAENSIALVQECLDRYGGIRKIREILSDHGAQFYANKRDKDGRSEHTFEKFLERKGIKHILARVKHPQTCGKIERWHYTYEKHRGDFETFEEFRVWYNTVRYHESLDTKWDLHTPEEAFWMKLPPECLLGVFSKMNEEDGW